MIGRLRAALADRDFTEQCMFGGLCFLVSGNMLACTSKRGLLVRVGKAAHAAAMLRPHTTAMQMGGRTMQGYILVTPPGAATDEDLRDWLDLALAHVGTLPAKPKGDKASRG